MAKKYENWEAVEAELPAVKTSEQLTELLQSTYGDGKTIYYENVQLQDVAQEIEILTKLRIACALERIADGLKEPPSSI